MSTQPLTDSEYSQQVQDALREFAERFVKAVNDGFGFDSHPTEMDLPRISEYESERWRAMSDELDGQAKRLEMLCRERGTAEEWRCIEHIKAASRSLFSAFSTAGGVIARGR